MFVADVRSVPMGLSGHGGFGFYKYAAHTELKTDARSSPFKTFRSTDSEWISVNEG